MYTMYVLYNTMYVYLCILNRHNIFSDNITGLLIFRFLFYLHYMYVILEVLMNFNTALHVYINFLQYLTFRFPIDLLHAKRTSKLKTGKYL